MKITWTKTGPSGRTEEQITEETFRKLTSDDECRFWNGFCGGTCRRSQKRAVAGLGYVWTRITRRDPDGRKHIDDFTFTKD